MNWSFYWIEKSKKSVYSCCVPVPTAIAKAPTLMERSRSSKVPKYEGTVNAALE